MAAIKESGSEIDTKTARMLSGRIVSRPRSEVPNAVPVALRSVQHVVVGRGRFEPTWSKRFVMIKWVISGKAVIGVGGNRLGFGPGEVAVHLPTNPHQFWALEETNEMCWFSVDGPLVEQFVLQLEISAGVHTFGPAPVQEIHEMMESLKDHSIQGRRQSSLLAIGMLYQIANSIRTLEIPSVVRQAQNMIQQEFADPDLSVESLAVRLGYHRGSLSRLFHQHTGETIMDYLTQMRLQEARALLTHTNAKIAEVGRKCGFREAAYFSRWLRKHTKTVPRELRHVP
jgi:AraC-like DNA-binding protein